MKRTRQWNTRRIGSMLVGLLVVAAGVVGPRYQRHQAQRAAEERRAALPVATEQGQNSEFRIQNSGGVESTSNGDPIPGSEFQPPNSSTNPEPSSPVELNLAVPFTSQAPHANWDHDHEEFCEEAAALMVGRFFQGRGIESPEDADTAFFELKAWEEAQLGTWESTTADETARMVREVYGLTVEIQEIASDRAIARDTIKQSLAEGKLVVVPAAGRALKNPYFKQPGPVYHMLVIKGYTQSGDLITNDPGTKRGADFVYTWERLYAAMGDWNDGDPEHGPKRFLIVSK